MGSGEERRSLKPEGPWRRPGSPAPLFDRLIDTRPREPEEARPHRVLARAELLESVRRELVRVLNTRCSESIEELKGQPRTVVNFGLPDFFALSPSSDRDRQRLASLIADAVRVYEPRLRSPAVDVVFEPSRSRELVVIVHGSVLVDDLPEPVSFALTIEERGGRMIAAADGGTIAIA
jgi:type VI secretion system protein ImpF